MSAADTAATSTDNRNAARLLALGGDGFRVRQTDHFTICYDTSYDAIRPLVGRLEGTYDAVLRFCNGHKLQPSSSPDRLSVLLFDRHEDFAAYGLTVDVSGDAIAGFYHHETNIAAFCNARSSPGMKRISSTIERAQARLQTMEDDSKRNRSAITNLRRDLDLLTRQRDSLAMRFNRFVLQHEAAHQMLFNLSVHVRGANNPTWLVEGLACQFEVSQTARDGRLRGVNEMRLADLRDALGVNASEKSISMDDYREAIRRGDVADLPKLIANGDLFADGDEKHMASYYAQSWGLVYYLHREFREPFTAYVRKLQARKPGVHVSDEAALIEFRTTFGVPDDEFSLACYRALLRLRLKSG